MIFIDRSVPKGVAEAIKQVRDDALWLEDRFQHDVSDETWLAQADACGWLVIARHKKVRSRPGERETLIRHGVDCFILNQKQDPTRWEYLQLLARTMNEMQERFAATPRPFIYTIDKNGILRQVA